MSSSLHFLSIHPFILLSVLLPSLSSSFSSPLYSHSLLYSPYPLPFRPSSFLSFSSLHLLASSSPSLLPLSFPVLPLASLYPFCPHRRPAFSHPLRGGTGGERGSRYLLWRHRGRPGVAPRCDETPCLPCRHFSLLILLAPTDFDLLLEGYVYAAILRQRKISIVPYLSCECVVFEPNASVGDCVVF